MLLSYAQNFEDIMIFRALGDKTSALYIDIGAWDPDKDSVTKLFYENGWSGINIEPSNIYYRKLCKKRPRDINLNIAIGATHGEMAFIEVQGSGLSSLDPDAIKRAQKHGLSSKKYIVQVESLNFVVNKYLPDKEIAFLKIDVEGFEKSIIDNVDWAHLRPIIIIVEAIHPESGQPTWMEWEGKLLAANYIFVWFDGLNKFYLRAEDSDLSKHFLMPPSLVDGFHLAPGNSFILPFKGRLHLFVKYLLPSKAYLLLKNGYQRFNNRIKKNHDHSNS